MIVNCNLIRDGLTATAVTIDVVDMNPIRRWIVSSIRHSGHDAEKYHFVAWSDLSDISATDRLEEVTGHATGIVFDVINKREMSGSHIEMDLEKHG